VGYITDAKQANALIENGTCDITLLGRQLLRNPHWPTHAAQELGVDPKPHMPVQYHVVAGWLTWAKPTVAARRGTTETA
jgi:2,4-dienoyl-CoA reductase-like NADH-dependent reductase (Old Yellow Enzyme family)